MLSTPQVSAAEIQERDADEKAQLKASEDKMLKMAMEQKAQQMQRAKEEKEREAAAAAQKKADEQGRDNITPSHPKIVAKEAIQTVLLSLILKITLFSGHMITSAHCRMHSDPPQCYYCLFAYPCSAGPRLPRWPLHTETSRKIKAAVLFFKYRVGVFSFVSFSEWRSRFQ
jgi:hypothetical protein